MNRHIASVHEEKQQFKFKICTASLDLNKDLNEHIESVHKGEPKLKCKICHISFELKIELNQQISSVHDGCITMVNNETLNHEKTAIIDNDLSLHNDCMIMCYGCEKPSTHFCKRCNQNFCKFCIINHYKT